MAIQWIYKFCPVILAIISFLFIPTYANALETMSMTLSPAAVSMTETLLADPSPTDKFKDSMLTLTIAGKEFKLSNTNEENCNLPNLSGTFTRLSFDNGDTTYSGVSTSQKANADSIELIRVTVRNSTDDIELVIFDSIDEKYFFLNLAQPANQVTLYDYLTSEPSIPTLEGKDALNCYSVKALTNVHSNNDLNSLSSKSKEASCNSASWDCSSSYRSEAARASTYNGYRDLLSALYTQGRIKLSTFASKVDTSFFKGGGWHHVNSLSGTQYAFSSYSSSNGSTEYLSQVALVDLFVSNDSSADKTHFGMQGLYHGGFVASYDKDTDYLTLLFADMGLALNDFQIGYNGLTNKAVVVQSLAIIDIRNSYQVDLYKAISNPSSIVSDVFTFLQFEGTLNSTEGRIFDSTYEAQANRYGNGQVIRGITINGKGGYLNQKNQYIMFESTIQRYNGTNTTWKHGFSYNASASI